MADEEVFEVEVVGGGRATVSDAASLCRLAVERAGLRLEAEAEGVFEALCVVRRRLEARGMLLRCHGAGLNVHLSPLSMSMGGGRMAYRRHLGEALAALDAAVV